MDDLLRDQKNEEYFQINEQYFYIDFTCRESQTQLLNWIIKQLQSNRNVNKNHLYVQLGYKVTVTDRYNTCDNNISSEDQHNNT